VIGFLIQFLFGFFPVPVFLVDWFNDRSGSGNYGPHSIALIVLLLEKLPLELEKIQPKEEELLR
jgi:hypothetical protein